jgi:ABC-type lipoprotein release transport system permease subunit
MRRQLFAERIMERFEQDNEITLVVTEMHNYNTNTKTLVLSGVAPARSAAKMNPVDALRFEQ